MDNGNKFYKNAHWFVPKAHIDVEYPLELLLEKWNYEPLRKITTNYGDCAKPTAPNKIILLQATRNRSNKNFRTQDVYLHFVVSRSLAEKSIVSGSELIPGWFDIFGQKYFGGGQKQLS